MLTDRYHRQTILPGIGAAGQAKLAAASVLIVGVGALGTTIAEQLARAGVGRLTLVDRDIVELSNLQRQVLFDEFHAADAVPKAAAAAGRLKAINSTIEVFPLIADFDQDNAREIIRDSRADVILDGTDNSETRYLINEWAVTFALPWIYGACVGMIGRAMGIRSNRGPCLQCVFPELPAPGELETCETAGILGPAASVTASLQAALALQTVVDGVAPMRLTSFDLWTGRFHVTDVSDGARPDCPTCGSGGRREPSRPPRSATRLCGRNTVQVRLAGRPSFDLLQSRLGEVGAVGRSEHALSFRSASGESLTIFIDGRTLVHGTDDPQRARALVARFIGV